MPYGKGKSKKTTKSRARNNRRRKTVARIPLGMPASKIVRLRYCDNFVINPAVGFVATHTISANSLHDPNTTGTGHQPLYYDSYSALYDHYVVLGAKISVHASSAGGTAYAPAIFGCLLEDDNSTLTGKTTMNLMEQKNTRYRFVQVGPNYQSPAARSITQTFSAKKFFGVGDVADNARLAASIGSSPADQAYFRIWLGAQNTVQDIPATNFVVTVEYIVKFTELKEQAES